MNSSLFGISADEANEICRQPLANIDNIAAGPAV